MNEDRQKDMNLRRITQSLSYRVAYQDVDFLMQPDMRAARMELEFLKPELYFQRANIHSTVVLFGSTQIVEPSAAQERLDRAQACLADTPQDQRRQRAVARAEELCKRSHYYETAREFARLASKASKEAGGKDYVIITGGGPGIMEGANRGAYEVGAKSIGLNIRLPREQQPNPYITPDLCFQFHYFAMRKLHFLLRAKALVVFPGGFGTLDEMFDALTLRQTGRMQEIPVIMFGREYWQQVINFDFLTNSGTVNDADLDLLSYAETAEEAWNMIQQFHRLRPTGEWTASGSDAWSTG